MSSSPKQTQCIYLIPTSTRVGLTSVSMGLVRALDRNGIKTAFFKPVAQLFRGDTGPERSTYVIRNTTDLTPPEPIAYAQVEKRINSQGLDPLLEDIMELYQSVAEDADIVVVEGLINMDEFEHSVMLNKMIARTLDASMVFVSSPVKPDLALLDAEIRNTVREFGGFQSERVMGAIINFVNAPRDASGRLRPDLDIEISGNEITSERLKAECSVLKSASSGCWAAFPGSKKWPSPAASMWPFI